MEWETFVIVVASIIAVLIIWYVIATGIGSIEVPGLR